MRALRAGVVALTLGLLMLAGPTRADECTTGSSATGEDTVDVPVPTTDGALVYLNVDASKGTFYAGYRTASKVYYYEVGRYPNGAIAAQVNIVPVGAYVGTDKQCTR